MRLGESSWPVRAAVVFALGGTVSAWPRVLPAHTGLANIFGVTPRV